VVDEPYAVETTLERVGVDPVVERADDQTRYTFVAPDGDCPELVRWLGPAPEGVGDERVALGFPTCTDTRWAQKG